MRKRSTYSFSARPELIEAVIEIAEERDTSLSAVITEALKRFLQESGKEVNSDGKS